MRKALFLLVVPALALGACGIGKQKSLDEFAVARNAPLVIPPDYSLTPRSRAPSACRPKARRGRRSTPCSAAPRRAARPRPACSTPPGATASRPGFARPRATPTPMSSTRARPPAPSSPRRRARPPTRALLRRNNKDSKSYDCGHAVGPTGRNRIDARPVSPPLRGRPATGRGSPCRAGRGAAGAARLAGAADRRG